MKLSKAVPQRKMMSKAMPAMKKAMLKSGVVKSKRKLAY